MTPENRLATSEDRLELWRGEFGKNYLLRNSPTEDVLRKLRSQWGRILRSTHGREVSSILEVGANLGLNLRALSSLTDARKMAVEPNAAAVERLVADRIVEPQLARQGEGLSIPFEDGAADLVFTSGVMIHIGFQDHEAVCREMLRVSRRFVLCVEYFSDQPREIEYRGYAGALFLRDFGRLWMDVAPSLTLVDYGFFYRHAGDLDSMNWWLFRK